MTREKLREAGTTHARAFRCGRCRDTGFLDWSWLWLDPCDHGAAEFEKDYLRVERLEAGL